MHAHNRGAALQDRAPQTEKMLSRKPFGRPKELWRGEGNTDDLVRNLESLNVKAGENSRNFMITKVKKQKGKSEKAKMQKGKKQKSQKLKKKGKKKDD